MQPNKSLVFYLASEDTGEVEIPEKQLLASYQQQWDGQAKNTMSMTPSAPPLPQTKAAPEVVPEPQTDDVEHLNEVDAADDDFDSTLFFTQHLKDAFLESQKTSSKSLPPEEDWIVGLEQLRQRRHEHDGELVQAVAPVATPEPERAPAPAALTQFGQVEKSALSGVLKVTSVKATHLYQPAAKALAAGKDLDSVSYHMQEAQYKVQKALAEKAEKAAAVTQAAETVIKPEPTENVAITLEKTATKVPVFNLEAQQNPQIPTEIQKRPEVVSAVGALLIDEVASLPSAPEVETISAEAEAQVQPLLPQEQALIAPSIEAVSTESEPIFETLEEVTVPLLLEKAVKAKTVAVPLVTVSHVVAEEVAVAVQDTDEVAEASTLLVTPEANTVAAMLPEFEQPDIQPVERPEKVESSALVVETNIKQPEAISEEAVAKMEVVVAVEPKAQTIATPKVAVEAESEVNVVKPETNKTVFVTATDAPMEESVVMAGVMPQRMGKSKAQPLLQWVQSLPEETETKVLTEATVHHMIEPTAAPIRTEASLLDGSESLSLQMQMKQLKEAAKKVPIDPWYVEPAVAGTTLKSSVVKATDDKEEVEVEKAEIDPVLLAKAEEVAQKTGLTPEEKNTLLDGFLALWQGRQASKKGMTTQSKIVFKEDWQQQNESILQTEAASEQATDTVMWLKTRPETTEASDLNAVTAEPEVLEKIPETVAQEAIYAPIHVHVNMPLQDDDSVIHVISEEQLLAQLTERLQPYFVDMLTGLVKTELTKQTNLLVQRLQEHVAAEIPSMVDELLQENLSQALNDIKNQ